MALPKWLDQSEVDYSHEKDALSNAVRWSKSLGWKTARKSGLDFDSRTSADLVLRKGENLVRFAVSQKTKDSGGRIRLQSVPQFREAVLIWNGRSKSWHIELGEIDINRDWDEGSLEWLLEQMTKP
jgi:hypothetical protein